MIKIKLFEEFDQPGFFKEIRKKEYMRDLYNNAENGGKSDDIEEFDESEIKRISSICKDIEICTEDKYSGFNFSSEIPDFIFDFGVPKHSLILDNIVVTKFKDEYYYVFDSTNRWFFKCDQIDGLISCIKKLNYHD